MITSFIIIGVVLLVYVSAGFAMSIAWKRNDIADVMWGPGAFIAALTALSASGDTVSTAPLAYLRNV